MDETSILTMSNTKDRIINERHSSMSRMDAIYIIQDLLFSVDSFSIFHTRVDFTEPLKAQAALAMLSSPLPAPAQEPT
jgi:hypothetical protein